MIYMIYLRWHMIYNRGEITYKSNITRALFSELGSSNCWVCNSWTYGVINVGKTISYIFFTILTLLKIYEGSKLDFRSWVLWFVKDPIKHSPFCRRQMSSRREPSDDDIVGQRQQAWLGHPLQAEQVKPAGGARGRYFMSLCVTSTISRYKILIGLNRSPNLTKTPTQPNPIPDAGLIKICRFFEF